MRALGGVLLIAAGLWSGIRARGELRERLELCGALCRLLERMAFELERYRTPLPDLFADLKRTTGGEAETLCEKMSGALAAGERFSAAWSRAMNDLPPRERSILEPLGEILGRYGAEEQSGAAERALRRMEDLRRQRERDLRERGRIRLGVCAGAGLMLAVLLL